MKYFIKQHTSKNKTVDAAKNVTDNLFGGQSRKSLIMMPVPPVEEDCEEMSSVSESRSGLTSSPLTSRSHLSQMPDDLPSKFNRHRKVPSIVLTGVGTDVQTEIKIPVKTEIKIPVIA